MHDRRHAGAGEDLRQRRGVVLVRMHAARRDEAHEMAGAAGLPQPLDQAAQRRRLLDLAVGDRVGDARQVLHHQAAGADVEMSDLGIAHLARRQADVLGPTCAGRRAGRSPTAGRRLACAPAGRRCRPHPRASPSRPDTTSITGRRFCGISEFLRVSPGGGKVPPCAMTARGGDCGLCVGLRPHRQPAKQTCFLCHTAAISAAGNPSAPRPPLE